MKMHNFSPVDGLLRDNTVLSAGMVISPIIICGNNLQNAVALIYAFSIITLFSVALASFVPQKLPYAAKIIAYAIISSAIFIPVKILTEQIYPQCSESIGIYFPLLAVNSLIVYQTEVRFFKMRKLKMISSLVFYILGFDFVILLVGFIRELLAYGTIYNHVVNMDSIISGIGAPFGGFIVLGLLCGIFRKLRTIASSGNDSDSEVK